MPVSNAPNNGPSGATSQVPVVFGSLPFLGLATLTSQVLFNDGLSGVHVWIRQTTGPGVLTVEVQFADGNVGGQPDFQDAAPSFPLALGVPSLNAYHLGSRRWRIRVTSTGVATARYRLTGSIT